MLFIQSNTQALSLTDEGRVRLLDALAASGRRPLLRDARRRLFRSLVESAVAGGEVEAAATSLELSCAARGGAHEGTAYAPGELFCESDCVLALVFNEAGASGTLAASVVYDLDTAEPLARLERFCREVQAALDSLGTDASSGEAPHPDSPLWRPRGGRAPQGLARFVSAQPPDFVRAAAALRGGRELARASELLEEREVREFLRRVE